MKSEGQIYIEEAVRKTSIEGKYDVIVCGGGPAGVAAAVKASRNGAEVLLLEKEGSLGGTWTNSLVTWLMDIDNKTGILEELVFGVRSMGSLYDRQNKDYSFGTEDMKYVMEQIVVRAGVTVCYHTLVVDVVLETIRQSGKDKPTVKGVITESKSGRKAFLAHIVVDATGDGDVAVLAGCGFDVGEAETQIVQPMSMQALICGLSPKEVRPWCLNYESIPGEAQQNFRELFERYKIPISYTMPVLIHLKGDLFSVSINHMYNVPCDDVCKITEATISARREILEALRKLAVEDKYWSRMIIVETSNTIGVREGRRIHGNYMITRQDIISGKHFEDGICEVTFNVDIHDAENGAWSDGGVSVRPYQIPLRSLIASDVYGMALAGRLICGDFYAHASYRVGGNELKTGEAAGVLAALAVRTGRELDQIPFVEVQKRI